MSFWVGSSFNDLLYPIPTFNLGAGMKVMMQNPEMQDAGQMWASDYGDVQNLAAWRNSYVLTANPDGTYRAIEKFPGGGQQLPLTLTRVPTPFGAEQFEAHGDATTNIPPWPEGSTTIPDTYYDEFGKLQTRNPIGRGSGESFSWENPDDWVLVTGRCTQMTQTCADPPTDIQWAASAHETTDRFYVEGGKPQEAYMKCNSCNGTWTETTQIINMNNVWHWMWNEVPERLPSGMRVDSNGHLTNLPFGLDVKNEEDALKKGVGVIVIDSAYQRKYSAKYPCLYYTNPEGGQWDEAECANSEFGPYTWGGKTVDFFKWAIDESKAFSRKNDIEEYWWAKTPTFTASCSDKKDPNYDDTVYYWDPTKCQGYESPNGSNGNGTGTGGSTGAIIATGVAITILTVGATIYSGGF